MLADRLPRFGWSGSHLDGAGSVVAERGTGDKELVLLSHIDTVPGGPEVIINEQVIRGRGSVDARALLCNGCGRRRRPRARGMEDHICSSGR